MTTKEIEKGFQEIWKLFKETERETKERSKELDKKLDRLEKQVEETSKTVKETSKTVEETSRAVYDLTGKWSRFVEGLIVPAAERLFKEWGIEVDKVYQRVKIRRNGTGMEVDILAINGEYAVLIEAKSTLKIEDIKEHIERLGKFKTFFPEYRDRKVVGAVAGIVIDEGVDRYAYREGMFVIGESGDMVKILNDDNFEYKVC